MTSFFEQYRYYYNRLAL